MDNDINKSWQYISSDITLNEYTLGEHISNITLNEYTLEDFEIVIDELENIDVMGSELTGNIEFHRHEYRKSRAYLDNIFAPRDLDDYGYYSSSAGGATQKYMGQTAIYNSHDAGLWTLGKLANKK